jgi:deoxyhypusine synthase
VGSKPTTAPIKGYDFNQGVDYHKIMESFATTGLQATNLSKGISIINEALAWRLSDEPITEADDEETKDPEFRKNVRCSIFLGYTSNMSSCGMRDIIRYLAQHKMIDCIVTSGGGI